MRVSLTFRSRRSARSSVESVAAATRAPAHVARTPIARASAGSLMRSISLSRSDATIVSLTVDCETLMCSAMFWTRGPIRRAISISV